MNILVTGAKGFVGKNLVAQLHNIQDGKARWYPVGSDLKVFEYDIDSDPAELETYCKNADFVFNLAGVRFMDSTGIGFLIGRYKKLQKYGMGMYLENPNAGADKILTLSGVYSLMPKI